MKQLTENFTVSGEGIYYPIIEGLLWKEEKDDKGNIVMKNEVSKR